MRERRNRSAVSKRSRPRRHAGYAGVIASLAVLAGFKGVLPVFRSHLMAYLGIGDGRLGLLLSIGALTGLAGNLLGGPMVDRRGPRLVIRACLAGIGAGMLIAGLAGPDWRLFVLAAGVSGFFGPPFSIAVNAYLASLFPRHRRRIISLNFASASFGGMFFPLAAEGLLKLSLAAEAVSFAQVLHGPFIAVGFALLGASFIYRPRRAPGGAPRPRKASARQNLSLPRPLLLLVVMMTMHGVADFALYAWMARFLESASFDRTLFPPGAVLSGYALAYLVSRAILAALPDNFGRRAFLVLPGLAGGLIMTLAILSRNYLFTAAGYMLAAFCWSFEFPVMVNMVLERGKKRFGATMALNGLAGGVLGFTVINMMGRLIEKQGEEAMWRLMLAPAGTFMLIGLVGLFWLAAFERKKPGSRFFDNKREGVIE